MAKKTKRIPKTIGGVKLPKELRQKGEALLDRGEALLAQANTPAGREVLTAGLTMAAAAASAAIVNAGRERAKAAEAAAAPEPAAPPTPPSPPPQGTPQGTQRTPDPQVIADALTQAAEQVLGRLFGGKKA